MDRPLINYSHVRIRPLVHLQEEQQAAASWLSLSFALLSVFSRVVLADVQQAEACFSDSEQHCPLSERHLHWAQSQKPEWQTQAFFSVEHSQAMVGILGTFGLVDGKVVYVS